MSSVPAIPDPQPVARPSFPFFTVVPWLMLASAIRFVAYFLGAPGLLLMALSDLAVFIAFLLAARGLIEWTGGQTRLGRMVFRDQLTLGWRILKRVFGLLVAAWLILAMLGAREIAPHMLYGFDGIAFDQFSKLGRVWSGLLAAIVLLMLVRAEQSGQPSLRAALAEFCRRAVWLVPAVAAVAIAQFGLNVVQGFARGGIRLMIHTPEIPSVVTQFAYFGFVFCFATIRLWAVVAILVYALRASYRPGRPGTATVKAE
jgi:hypothetical protein